MDGEPDAPCRNEALELHVRCVPGEDKVQLYLALRDGNTLSFNRPSDSDMASTLRRLSLTVQKRRRLTDKKKKGANGGKAKGSGKKGPQSGKGGVGNGEELTAALFDKGTGEPIVVDGALNGDGWVRLCGNGESNHATPAGETAENTGDFVARAAAPQGSEFGCGNGSTSSQKKRLVVVRIGHTTPATAAAAAADDDAATEPSPSAGAADTASADDGGMKIPGAAAAAAAAAAGEDAGFLEMDVVVNPPAVTSLECSIAQPMAGFTVVAQAEAEFGTGMGWEWLIEEGEQPVAGGSGGGGGGGAAAAADGLSRRGGFTRVVGRMRAYTPVDADVGLRLMVRCTPMGEEGRRGRPVVRVLTSPVRPGRVPGPLALRRRWLEERGGRVYGGGGEGSTETEGLAGGTEGGVREGGGRVLPGGAAAVGGTRKRRRRRLRVMCYNILADMYCTSEQADKVLYPYCPKEYRAMDYRMQMVAREVRGHAADLVMLQECEAKAFDRFLSPGLAFDGFEGIYANKAGQAQEGEAIFYRSSVLTLESRHDFSMKDAIPAQEEFRGLLEAFPILSVIVEERLTTVAQVAVFRPASGGDVGGTAEVGDAGEEGSRVRVIVANTHLYFHPNAAHIRLMQLVTLVERISRVRKDLLARGLRPAVVLGGDLNSPPGGPVRYLMGDLIGPDSDLWENVGTFKWGDRFFDELPTTSGAAATPPPPPPPPTSRIPDGKASTASPRPTTATNNNDNETTRASHPSVAGSKAKPPPFLPDVPYLRTPLDLELASGTPAFTNFTPEFTDTLDYVFIEGAGAGNGTPTTAAEAVLAVEGAGGTGGGGEGGGGGASAAAVAPMPEEGPLRATTPGLPSETFPSDHVSLVVDLALSA